MDDKSLITGGGDEALGFDLIAASLRADTADTRAFLNALAAKLEGALPGPTLVERARDGLFSGSTHVRAITVTLPKMKYSLVADKRGALQASLAKIVGGIAIKTESVGVDAWIETLARDLAVYAESSAGAHSALRRLLT